MSKSRVQMSDFQIVCQLLGFIIKDGYKIKYLRVAVSEREYWIKLPKKLRQDLNFRIVPGCWLEIRGNQKTAPKKGLKLEAKAMRITSAPQKLVQQLLVTQPEIREQKTTKASILICQKADCWQRGGKAVCQLLASQLSDRGLTDQVQIKTIGCLKQCKHGPNLIILPDKARYSQVKTHQVKTLLDRHFPLSQLVKMGGEKS